MNRKYLNLALLVLFLGLGAVLYFGDEQDEEETPLTALAAADVERVQIDHPQQTPTVLVKQDGDWRLSSPVEARADNFEVNSLLALADTPVHKQFPAAGTDLAGLGLSPPKYTITLNNRVIDFGDTEPLQHQRYVMLDDEVALIDDLGSAAFDEDPSDLVAKTLLPDGARLSRIELPNLVLVRKDDRWQSEPGRPEATSERIETLVDAWSRARAMWNEAMPETGGGDPLTLVLEEGREIHLIVAAREPQLILERPDYGVRYHLSKALADELLRLPPATDAAADEPETTEAAPPAAGPG